MNDHLYHNAFEDGICLSSCSLTEPTARKRTKLPARAMKALREITVLLVLHVVRARAITI